MRLLYFITTLTFISINAQTTDVVTGLNYPLGLAIDGNDLYIAEQSGNKVSKIDITATTPTTSTDVTNVNYKPTGLAIKSGLFTKDLYISAFSTSKIFKLDLNASSPALIEFFSPGFTYPRPAGLAINGDDLLVADYNKDEIYKISTTATSPVATTVRNGINGPYEILLNGNDLYIAEFDGSSVAKIDITITQPAKVILSNHNYLSNPHGIALKDNYLYFSQFNNNKISRIDITATTPITPTDVVTGLNKPSGIVISGNDLYIAEAGANKISKFNLSTLSEDDVLSPKKVSLFPNPSSEFIQLSGLTERKNYKIYNLLGSEIKNGNIINNEKININDFINGLYFLNFDNGKTLKFLKK